MNKSTAGYREIEHTADWELQVWAPDLPGLLEQAARGMYSLSGTRLQAGERMIRRLVLPLGDRETLLVQFLSELLWLSEQDGLGFDTFKLEIKGDELHAWLEGAEIANQSKEIKAVTFHQLAIRKVEGALDVNIVFDV